MKCNAGLGRHVVIFCVHAPEVSATASLDIWVGTEWFIHCLNILYRNMFTIRFACTK